MRHKQGNTEVYYYYVTNLQGDVIAIVDDNGSTAASYEYDPYGGIISATGTLADINPMRYRGYYYDAETTLYYLQSRYYDPGMGRFINADSFASTGQGPLGDTLFGHMFLRLRKKGRAISLGRLITMKLS